MTDAVRKNVTLSRYELEVNGRLAVAEYRLTPGNPGTISFTHTEVPRDLQGRGIGAKLAQGALAQAHAEGMIIEAVCSFMRRHLDNHPEWTGRRSGQARC